MPRGGQWGLRPEEETEPAGPGGSGKRLGAAESSLVGLCCLGTHDLERERVQIETHSGDKVTEPFRTYQSDLENCCGQNTQDREQWAQGRGPGRGAFKTEGGGEGEVTQEGQAVRALHAEGSVQGRTERQLQKPKPSREERGRGKRSCEDAGWGGAGRWALGIPRGPAWLHRRPAEPPGPASV